MEPQSRREFTNESYMNPSPDNPRYFGRDPVIGKQEAQKRLMYLPQINEKSIRLLTELGVPIVALIPKGSTVVERCTRTSDFDIAVVVEPDHMFTKQPELWRKYQEGLAKTEVEGLDFKIEHRLVVEENRFRPLMSPIARF